jgi:hypothetical protein
MIRNKTMALIALLVAASPAQAMFGFQPPQTYLHEGEGVEWEGKGVLVHDLNGDGLDDVVLAYNSDFDSSPWNRLAVFLQNPATHQLSPPVTYPVVRAGQGKVEVSSLQEIDTNGDGKKEIIVGHSLGFSVLDPANNFAILAVVEVPSAHDFDPMLARGADINGNGFADAVFMSNDFFDPPHAWIYVGDGQGNFSFVAERDFPERSGDRDIRLEDLNADGKPDLLIFSLVGFDAYYNNGTGGFGMIPSLTVRYGSYGQMAVGDLDGDGKPDLVGGSALVQGDTTSYGIRAYFHGKLRRPYLSSRAWRTNPGVRPDAIRIDDVNADGKPDLLFTEGNWLWSQDENGNYRCFLNFAPSGGTAVYRYPHPCTYGPDAIGIGDINGDGLLDFVSGDPSLGLGWSYGTNAQPLVNLVVGEGLSPGTAAFNLKNGSTSANIAAPSVEITYTVNRGKIELSDWPQECSRPDPHALRLVCNYPDLAAGQSASGIVHYGVLQSQPYMQLHAEAKASTATEETVSSDNTATAAMWIRQL